MAVVFFVARLYSTLINLFSGKLASESYGMSIKIIIYISLLTSLVFILALLATFVFVPFPSFLTYLGYADIVTLVNPNRVDDALTSQIVGELVKKGTLVSLNDVWGFQTDLYQTIIAFLIAINGLIAAISVIYIKGTSEEKAEEITKRYMSSDAFDFILNAKVEREAEKRLRAVQDDFNSSVEVYEQSVEAVRESQSRLELLERENKSLRQQLKVISERVSLLDNSESDGKDFQIFKRDV